MALFITYARRSLLLSRVRASTPVIAVFPRSFMSSPQNFKKDLIKDAPGWDSAHATESEADVKADRQRPPKDMSQLQDETVEFVNDDRTSQAFKKKTEQLGKKFGKVGEKIGEESEEVVEDLSNLAQKAGAKLGKVAGKVEKAEEAIKKKIGKK
ncbi:hypothetical protein BGZ76_007963 [Entomortierella beljakovae]|nr:hypothetical protein BGZ76_007963 [Entomortierella beljakovae]